MSKDPVFVAAAPDWFVRVGEEYQRVPFWVFVPDVRAVVAGGLDGRVVPWHEGYEVVHLADMSMMQRGRRKTSP